MTEPDAVPEYMLKFKGEPTQDEQKYDISTLEPVEIYDTGELYYQHPDVILHADEELFWAARGYNENLSEVIGSLLEGDDPYWEILKEYYEAPRTASKARDIEVFLDAERLPERLHPIFQGFRTWVTMDRSSFDERLVEEEVNLIQEGWEEDVIRALLGDKYGLDDYALRSEL